MPLFKPWGKEVELTPSYLDLRGLHAGAATGVGGEGEGRCSTSPRQKYNPVDTTHETSQRRGLDVHVLPLLQLQRLVAKLAVRDQVRGWNDPRV